MEKTIDAPAIFDDSLPLFAARFYIKTLSKMALMAAHKETVFFIVIVVCLRK